MQNHQNDNDNIMIIMIVLMIQHDSVDDTHMRTMVLEYESQHWPKENQPVL